MALGAARRHENLTAVMFIDLDGFKAVNDSLGHDAGDYVLREVANRLVSSVRATDTVARVGGDEFLLIAIELHCSDDAAFIAHKVIHAVSQPIVFNSHTTVVGASIGIALYPNHGEDINQLIKLADEAMYRIKNSGKNGFGFAASATK
jgi:diguanylate cyclase (GGDEF)-like protein